MIKDMKPSENSEFTVVKNEFPNGWKETPFELLFKRLDENGFSIKATHEVAADENVMDARPHADIYVIEKDGREFRFQIGLTRDLRHDKENLDGIGWFKASYAGKAAPVKFEIPPDQDVDAKCAAVEYWIRDITNYVNGTPLETRKFNYEYWEKVKHPDKYFGHPLRLVEPKLYDAKTVKVIPTTKPKGLAFARKYLMK